MNEKKNVNVFWRILLTLEIALIMAYDALSHYDLKKTRDLNKYFSSRIAMIKKMAKGDKSAEKMLEEISRLGKKDRFLIALKNIKR